VTLVLSRGEEEVPESLGDEVLPLDDTPADELLDAILAADLVVLW
jgi:hypothetical protein